MSTARPIPEGWLLPGAIVVAGVVIAIAVLITRNGAGPEPSPVPVPQNPVGVQPAPEQPPVLPTTAPTQLPPVDPGDVSAQTALQTVVDSARGLRGSTNSYVNASSLALAQQLPSFTFAQPSEGSTGPSVVSVSATPDHFAAAVKSTSGSCFWIKDEGASVTTYGSGTTCTGMAAAAAALPSWPVPSPVSPATTPATTSP